MQLKHKIFDNYYSIHGKFLEDNIAIKQKWFDNGGGAGDCWFEYREILGAGKIGEEKEEG